VNLPINISSIFIPHWIEIVLGFLMAFGITWVTIPSIVSVARLKGLCANANNRTLHTCATPTLGGIAVFVALVLTTVIFGGTYFKFELKYIISGLIIVFFMGIKDDILIIDPLKKLAGQILAIGLIAVFADIRITSLFGLFHIQQLPYVVSILLTIFVFIVIINGFNLIDGIDGLASGIGILTSSVFGIWFWIAGHIACTILSFSLVGTLAAFFYFNVFSKRNKIFLGDTGSMVIGFVVGVLVCRFLQHELVAQGTAKIVSAPTVVCGILIVPLFDSLRVFILRIKQGRSPFKADRKHIHHRLLQLGCTHLQATLILISVNLFFIVLSYLLRGIGIIWLMGVIVGLASLMSHVLVVFVEERRKKEIDSLIASYFTVKILQGRRKIAEIAEKQSIKILTWNYQEKVNADLN
jgi:UDP-N-acetylmuramyl pentapeptide phosphotransferase/UDP-N-acetylglucosamine-1-phosphate transferase